MSPTMSTANLIEWLPKQRWFRAKSRKVSAVTVVDKVPVGDLSLDVLRVDHDGGSDDYVMLVDANGNDVLGTSEAAEKLLACFGGPVLTGVHTTLRFDASPSFAERGSSLTPKLVSTEQTNSSILYGDSFVLKILRQIDEGLSPDMEMGEFLTLAGYEHAPRLVGSITLERGGKHASTLGVLHRFTPNRGDAWTFTLEALRSANADSPALAELLGRRVGQMHTALVSRSDIPAFAPERISRDRRYAMVKATLHSLDRAVEAVTKRGRTLDARPIRARLERFVDIPSDPIATRVHGDLHLGQVLVTTGATPDFALIDFEGEPARPLALRKGKRPPLADVAGMLRSFHYAAMTIAHETPSESKRARAWFMNVRAAFLRGWSSAAPSVAKDEEATTLDFCLLEKCIYEVSYEADNRPDWLDIPLEGLTAT